MRVYFRFRCKSIYSAFIAKSNLNADSLALKSMLLELSSWTKWRLKVFSFKLCKLLIIWQTKKSLIANGDDLNLILPTFARPLCFFSHQAFWHFNE